MVKDVFDIVGTTLSGAYRVENVVAEGGFGVVYRAEHLAFRASVALKCLKIPATMTALERADFVESFREEAEMLFHLSAKIPEVVRPMHVDAVLLPSGTLMPFIAMEWLQGTPLDAIIVTRAEGGQPPLGLLMALRMLTPIAHALERAHRFELVDGQTLGIVHCDLKPENVLIGSPERGSFSAKLLDFGIAKARAMATNSLGRITESDRPSPFTPSYGAPEQWLPKVFGTTGPWTDVWGMALTLVECITGRAPIDGELQGMMGTALDAGRRPTPRNEGAVVSDAVEAVFARALAVNPRDRYTAMASFWRALESALGLESSFPSATESRRERAHPDAEFALGEDPPDGSLRPSMFGPTSVTVQDAAAMARTHKSPHEFASADSAAEAGGNDPTLEMKLRVATDLQRFKPGPVPQSDRGVPSLGRPAGAESAPSQLSSPPLSPPPRTLTLPLAFELDHGEPIGSERSHFRQENQGFISGMRPAAVAARPHSQPLRGPRRSSLFRSLRVLAVGVAIVLVDMGLTVVLKTPVALGSFRLRWLGAIVVAVGLVLALVSFAASSEAD